MLVLISILSVICGILVIITKNPVRSVLFLIALFMTIALYLFGLKFTFIALSYLLVYVGAVSILFLFILMLINVRVSELTTNNNNSIPLSIIIVTIFSITFSNKSLFSTNKNMSLLYEESLNNIEKNIVYMENNDSGEIITGLFSVKENNEKVSLAFSCIWDNILNEMSHITGLGNILYTSYSLGILIVGLILLLSMIGAISITVLTKKT